MNKQVTLDDLNKREKEVLKEIRLQEKKIGDIGKNAFQPLKPAVTFSDTIANSLNSFVSLYKGLRLGFKAVRMIKAFQKEK
jgi:hypothetical protein